MAISLWCIKGEFLGSKPLLIRTAKKAPRGAFFMGVISVLAAKIIQEQVVIVNRGEIIKGFERLLAVGIADPQLMGHPSDARSIEYRFTVIDKETTTWI